MRERFLLPSRKPFRKALQFGREEMAVKNDITKNIVFQFIFSLVGAFSITIISDKLFGQPVSFVDFEIVLILFFLLVKVIASEE